MKAEAGTGEGQVDSELITQAGHPAGGCGCFPAYAGGQGGMEAYSQVYPNREDSQLDMELGEAFSRDLESYGLSSAKWLQR